MEKGRRVCYEDNINWKIEDIPGYEQFNYPGEVYWEKITL